MKQEVALTVSFVLLFYRILLLKPKISSFNLFMFLVGNETDSDL